MLRAALRAACSLNPRPRQQNSAWEGRLSAAFRPTREPGCVTPSARNRTPTLLQKCPFPGVLEQSSSASYPVAACWPVGAPLLAGEAPLGGGECLPAPGEVAGVLEGLPVGAGRQVGDPEVEARLPVRGGEGLRRYPG